MSMLGTKDAVFNDGRTKQSFRDETDINQILKRAQKSGTISHMTKFQPRYGDFSNFDFLEAQVMLAKGGTIFDELPVELRREFNQSPAEFFDYVNDPANKERLAELLPALAEPGRQNVIVSGAEPADVLTKADEAAKEVAALKASPDKAKPEKGSKEPDKPDKGTKKPDPAPSSSVT